MHSRVLGYVLCVFASISLLPAKALAGGWELSFAEAQITSSSTNVTLIEDDIFTGRLGGVSCIFANGNNGLYLHVTVDGTTSSYFFTGKSWERESNGAGRYVTDWIALETWAFSSMEIELEKVGSGSDPITCWASYATYIPE